MSRLQKIGAGILLLIGLAPYLVSLNGPFIYDDIDQILRNPAITNADSITDAFDSTLRRVRAIQNMTFIVNWWITPGSTYSFHIFNLLLHLLNGFLVWRFLTHLPWERVRNSATVATALFLIHPLQSQAITYVMGNISLLQFFFYILALNLVVKKENVWLTGVVIAVSLLAKETCALIPFAILALRITAHGDDIKTAASRFPQVFYFLISLLLLPVLAVLKDPLNMYVRTAGFGLYPAFEYYLTQAHYLFLHLYLLVSPSSQSILHPYPQFSTAILISGTMAIVLSIKISILLWHKRRQHPELSFFWLLFWISTLPIIAIQLINPFAEYRLYQGNFVIFVFAAIGLNRLLQAQRERVRAVVYTALVLLAFFLNTGLQRTWRDSLSLLEHAQSLYPESAILTTMIGNAYLSAGDKTKAEAEFKRGVELHVNEPLADERFLVMLAYFYHFEAGEPAKALEVLDKSPRHPKMFAGVKPLPDWYTIHLHVLKKLELTDRYLEMRQKADTDYSHLDWENISGMNPVVKQK